MEGVPLRDLVKWGYLLDGQVKDSWMGCFLLSQPCSGCLLGDVPL